MTIELRPATESEMEQFGRATSYAYGGASGDGADNFLPQVIRPEWTMFAFDGPKVAATFSTIPFTMRANGLALAMGGVCCASTEPEYRRQGLLRQIMTQELNRMGAQGRSVATLWASQAAIYQRFGFSMASVNRQYTVDTVDIRFIDGNGGHLPVSRVDGPRGMDIVDTVYHAFIAPRTGYLHRTDILWKSRIFKDNIKNDGPFYIAIAFEDEQPMGYIVYTLRARKVSHIARHQEIVVRDLAWLSPDAYRSLWSFLARHDLVGRIWWGQVPSDDPAPEFFLEPRLLHSEDREGLWLRIVDVAGALQGRGYQATDKLILAVEGDDLVAGNNGVWQVDASPEATRVTRSHASPDVRLSIKALASLYTGFRDAQSLAAWGLLQGEPDAIERLTRLFATRHAPHCPDMF